MYKIDNRLNKSRQNIEPVNQYKLLYNNNRACFILGTASIQATSFGQTGLNYNPNINLGTLCPV